VAKAAPWPNTDAETRKRGERTGLDTPVVTRLGSTAARLKLKGIDGGPHKRWSMGINSSLTEEPYQGLTSPEPPRNRGVPRKRSRETGVAWLSSARVVRCWVKSRNERNPHPMLPA
jgi:hypothetical protein